jgi:PAS domain S-box-containing protein
LNITLSDSGSGELYTIKVLLVDDEKDLLEIGQAFLESDHEMSVVTSSSASQALELIKLQEFDVVVSDYQMPGKDGIQLLKEIRALGNKIPFILFTGRGREEVVIEALNNGADFYLQKGGDPASQFAELINTIKHAYSKKQGEHDLIMSVERYRSLFENSVDGVMLTTFDGSILSANPSACQMFGMTEQDLQSSDLEKIMVKDEIWDLVHRKGKMGGTTKGVFTFRRKDSVTFVGDATFGFFIDLQGNGKVSMIVRDITEKNSKELKLKASEQRYRRLFETAQDGILIVDYKSELIIDANKFILDLTGYSLEATLNRNLWELGFMRDKELADSAFSELKKTGHVRYEDIPLKRNNGDIIPVEFISNVYMVGDTKIIQCNIRDIRERYLLDQKILELARIVASSYSAVIGEDARGTVTSWNNGAERMFGYSADEIIGQSISLLSSPGSVDDSLDLLPQVLKGGFIKDHETSRLRKDGTSINVTLSISPINDENGKIVGVSTIANHNTERKPADDSTALVKDLETDLNSSPT